VRLVVVVALALAVSGLAALVWTLNTAGAVDRPVRPAERYLTVAYPAAAAAAYGRRVLVVHNPPLEPAHGDVYESARSPGGWELYAAAPAGARAMHAAMQRIAAQASSDWEDDRRLSEDTIHALAEAGVAIVVVEDGRRIVSPEEAADVPGVSPEAGVPSLRVRGAEPVMRVPEGLDAGLRTVARTRDFEDGLWGGSVVVEVEHAGRYVFAWPAEGARVTIDGVVTEAQSYSDALPLVAADLPAGTPRVEVRYADAGRRAWVAMGGALALTIGVLLLLLAFRAHPDRERDA